VKSKRFSVEQIVVVLKQAEVGVPVAELIRQVGISEQTLYRWKKQYKGLETDQVRQFKQLQAAQVWEPKEVSQRIQIFVACMVRPVTAGHGPRAHTGSNEAELLLATLSHPAVPNFLILR